MKIRVVVPKSRSKDFYQQISEDYSIHVIDVKVGELQDSFVLDVHEFHIKTFPTWVAYNDY
ncbi:hypothetical protein NCTGTJJY_CDS0226 [Serratia phage 92A1]|nr:hypothetical protein NCTGTJJY_CDS0226 [Serratia phage 92A1]